MELRTQNITSLYYHKDVVIPSLLTSHPPHLLLPWPFDLQGSLALSPGHPRPRIAIILLGTTTRPSRLPSSACQLLFPTGPGLLQMPSSLAPKPRELGSHGVLGWKWSQKFSKAPVLQVG